jgi:hypothetical protein
MVSYAVSTGKSLSTFRGVPNLQGVAVPVRPWIRKHCARSEVGNCVPALTASLSRMLRYWSIWPWTAGMLHVPTGGFLKFSPCLCQFYLVYSGSEHKVFLKMCFWTWYTFWTQWAIHCPSNDVRFRFVTHPSAWPDDLDADWHQVYVLMSCDRHLHYRLLLE